MSNRVRGEDSTKLADPSVGSALLGVGSEDVTVLATALLAATLERGVAISPSGPWCTIFGP